MNYHDTGYKELFSHPEFVQQLIEGFAPREIAAIMDFSTLEQKNGNYITPLFEERFEDIVWSVKIEWGGVYHDLYLYILLEFQSTVDATMPLRLLHYVTCFYEHLIKNKVCSATQLPPVFPIVLYNGLQRWRVVQDVYDMLSPVPPEFLRRFQPQLHYYLVDEGAFSHDELLRRDNLLSGIFEIEQTSERRELLQLAVDRIVRLIEQDANKERLDKVITRWLKRHLVKLGAEVNLDDVDSLVDGQSMLAENLEHWAERERREGLEQGLEQGREQGLLLGRKQSQIETALKMLAIGSFTTQQIADLTGLSLNEVVELQ